MNKIHKVTVLYHDRIVGILAETKAGEIAFEYDKKWLIDGFSISPFALPLEKGVFISKKDTFDGLFGVFFDSLPDGWGRLLVDRLLMKKNIDPDSINELNRLAIVGKTGMGAFTYEPHILLEKNHKASTYDELSIACTKILNTEYSENLDELFTLGGSSGGARPKILTTIQNQEWIIKFPSSMDPKIIGLQEYQYALCAKKCGIILPDIYLYPSHICSGYFGVRIFDTVNCNEYDEKIHMISVSALLETSHRIPNLDYSTLMQLTRILTKNESDLYKLFRLMCFNVFSHNRDDHSKNFSFLYLEDKQQWTLSPAYDLTYSSSIGGEHATCVNGNGDPGKDDIMEVARIAGLNRKKSFDIMNQIEHIVQKDLKAYLEKKMKP